MIDLLPEQRGVMDKGGTMRLGLYPIVLEEGSAASIAYGQGAIQERHRHRYEVNNDYLDALRKGGLRISGIWPDKQLVEVIELPDHPWFVAGQFHPEFRSRPWEPHPALLRFHQGLARPPGGGVTTTRAVRIAGVTVGGGAPLALIGGPCAIEDDKHALMMAERLAAITVGRRRCRSSTSRPTTRPTARRSTPTAGRGSARACASCGA